MNMELWSMGFMILSIVFNLVIIINKKSLDKNRLWVTLAYSSVVIGWLLK